MIVLDASLVIALRERDDAHAAAARSILVSASAGSLALHPVTLAEFLVGPARFGQEIAARRILLNELGVELTRPSEDEPLVVARLRAATRLSLPECYVLVTAQILGASLATFDARLAAAARGLGLDVLDAAGSG